VERHKVMQQSVCSEYGVKDGSLWRGATYDSGVPRHPVVEHFTGGIIVFFFDNRVVSCILSH
jgi:hypothetical protein